MISVGGGGVIAGVATALKRIRSAIRVIGVEPESSQVGFPVSVDVGNNVADGLAVSRVGRNAFASAFQCEDDIVVVPEEAIAEAIATFFGLQD